MTVRVTVLNEVKTDDPGGGDWKLAFQWCRYVEVEEGNRYHGYRFIWYRPNGRLQAARGQARLHSLSLIRDLLERAESEGWGSHDALDYD